MQQNVTISQVQFIRIKKIPRSVRRALFELFYRLVPDKEEGGFRRYYPLLSLEYLWLFPPSWKQAYLLHLTEKMKRDLWDYTNEQWTNYPFEKEIQVYSGRTKIKLMIGILEREYPEKIGSILVYPYQQTNPFWDEDTGKSKCIICLEDMIPKNSKQMFCSPICRNKSYIKSRRNKEITRIWLTKDPIYAPDEIHENCLNCDRPLPDNKRSHRKFCGTACRVAHHRKID
jgi:hypothetical protein